MPEAGTTPTAHELNILATYVKCGTMKATAHHLGIAEATVKDNLGRIRHRFGCDTTVQAAVFALNNRLLPIQT